MYDLGDVAVLAIQIRDTTNTLANAGAVTCTITLPDSTTSPATVTNPTTGNYTATYTPTQVGRHNVYWQATGANASAQTDIFDVKPTTSTALLSLADVRAALNFTATLDDEEVRMYSQMATALIERRTGPILNRTVTETIHGWNTVALSHVPVVSVTSITADLTGGTAVDPANLFIDGTTGIIRRLDRGTFYNDTYTITYVAGRGTVVADQFKLAAIHLIEHLWAGQRGTGFPGDTAADDGYSASSAYSLPLKVLQDIEMDLKVAGIA
jgi:hypothetical protein